MAIDASVTHVRLLVDEYPATFRFYRDVLGLSAAFGDAESGYADLETGDVTLALFDASEMTAAVEDGQLPERGGDRAVVVLRVADVDDAAETLRERGVALASPPADHPEWGIRTVHCRDPDGTLVEFNEPLDH